MKGEDKDEVTKTKTKVKTVSFHVGESPRGSSSTQQHTGNSKTPIKVVAAASCNFPHSIHSLQIPLPFNIIYSLFTF